MENKEIYEELVINVITFDSEDVIVTSLLEENELPSVVS
jgi:hypothetical protein